MHNDILCAMMTMAPNNKQKQEKPQKHQGPIPRVQEATKLNAETRDPPARIPEITKSSLHGMTFTLTL